MGTPAPNSLDMEQEVNRLATFKNWPCSAPVTANALARAGFFFLGIGDQVQCYACLGIIKDWEFGDLAMGKHKKHYPRCPFVRDPTYKNVPLVAEQAKSGAAGGGPVEKLAKEKAAELYKAPNNAKKSQSGKKGSGKPVKGGGFNESLKSCEGNPTRQPTIDSVETEVRLTFRSEYNRLLSYHSWPRNHPMDPRYLAKAGFYFLDQDDIVQCFACFGKIRDWEPQDIPRQEHARHFPSCPFVKGLDVENEPITDLQMANAVSIAYREPSGYENTLQQFSKQLEAALPQTAKVTSQWEQVASPNCVLNRPKYPDYAGENARVATYDKGWPGILGITPQQLARAGFFYTGEGDSTKCFYCGGGLKHWESTDEPWTEHAKWFSVCEWLLQQRGTTFVSYVVRNFPVDMSRLRQARNAQMMPSAAAKGFKPAPASQEPPEDEAGVIYKKFSMDDQLDMAMNSPLTKRIVKVGYDANLVKQVVRRQLQTSGKAFKISKDFLAAVWQAEEMQKAGTWKEDIEEGEDRGKTQNSVNATGGHEGAVHPSKQFKGKKKKGTNVAQMMPSAAAKGFKPAPASQEPPEDEAGVIYKKFSMDDQLDMSMNSQLTKRIVKEGYDADLVKQVVRRQLRRAGKAFKKFKVFLAVVRQAKEMREAGTWEEDIEEGEREESRGGANRGAKEGMQNITAEVPEKWDRRKTQNSVNATGGHEDAVHPSKQIKRKKKKGTNEMPSLTLIQKLEGMSVGQHQGPKTVGQSREVPAEWLPQQSETGKTVQAVWQAKKEGEAGTWEEVIEEGEAGEESRSRAKDGAKEGLQQLTAELPEKQSKDVRRADDKIDQQTWQMQNSAGATGEHGGACPAPFIGTAPAVPSRKKRNKSPTMQLAQSLEGMSFDEHQASETVGQTREVLTEELEEIEREIERLRDEKLCKVCMDNDANTVLMPCTHLVVCDMCANSLRDCPICRQTITDVVKFIKS